MSISRMVQTRLSTFSTIRAAIEHYHSDLATELHALLSQYLAPGETLSAQDLQLALKLLERHYIASANKMQTSDEEHSREVGEDVVARRKLEEATASSYQGLRDFKLAVRNGYGPELLEEMQIQGTTPTDYQQLSQQYGLVLNWLSNSSKSFPATTGMFSVGLKKADVLSTLSKLGQALDKAIEDYRRDKRETEDAMLEKNENIGGYDKAETHTSSIFSSFLDMVGRSEEAGRLRPTRRKVKATGEETPAESQEEQGETTPETPTS